MKTRLATAQDSTSVIALWQACGLTRPWNDPQHDFKFAVEGPSSCVLVLESGEQIVATVMVGHDGHRGAVYYLAVMPDQQRKGFGKLIHEAAVNWLRSKAVWKINLMFRNGNTQVKGFYETLGYEINEVVSLGKRIDG